ncbi:MAG: NUMOD3 domain-containing DNA-binding protein [Mucilaginibacter sp.]|uniref:NUMOD3 domain-containing DNA-binding protein n=1 Tax=Mucilaginibacter sp. TaxID=1882438 RepID=UPI0032651AD7
MSIGIYKITCIKNKRVYIGQSVDLEKRLHQYKIIKCKKQPKIYRSLLKYGVSKHKFEVVVECDIEDLNKWERYYQDLYSACGKNGLNCQLTESDNLSGTHSEETRAKISLSAMGNTKWLGRKHTPESIEKIRKAKTGIKKAVKVVYPMERVEGMRKNCGDHKPVVCIETGIEYYSIAECARQLDIHKFTLYQYLSGYNKLKSIKGLTFKRVA